MQSGSLCGYVVGMSFQAALAVSWTRSTEKYIKGRNKRAREIQNNRERAKDPVPESQRTPDS